MNNLKALLPLFVLALLTCDHRVTCPAQGNQDVIPELIKRLDDQDFEVFHCAADSLIKLGEKAVPALIAELKSPATEGRVLWITWILGEIGSSSVAPLTRELDNADIHVRLRAIDGLVRVGAAAKTAVPTIGRLLKDPNHFVRSDAAFALGELRDESAIPNLVTLLKGEIHRGVQQSAITAIGKFGPKAKGAVPALINIVVNPAVDGISLGVADSDPCNLAVSALAEIGADSVLPLAEVLENPKYPRVARRTAGWGMVQLGSRASSEVPRLIKIMDDPDPQIREMAIWVLGAIGPKATPALSRLLKALGEPAAKLQLSSASAIRTIDPQHKAVLPALLRCLREKEAMIRVGAAIEVGAIGPDAYIAIGDLVRLMKDEDERCRRAAADSLAGIGPKASDAIPALSAALNDNDRGVRESAANAIKAIAKSP